MNSITIRPLCADDGELAGAIFFDAVHHGTTQHYTPEQREAWAGAQPNPAGWRIRLSGMDGYWAEKAGAPAGFMTIDASGYIDLAYVRPELAGHGIGWRLYLAVEERARQLGAVRLTTEVSLVARPFFERQGWHVDREQVVLKRGVKLTNFRMSKSLITA